MRNRWIRATCVAVALAGGGCAGAEESENLVARVDDYRLTVDQAVELLVDEEGLATNIAVVRSLADFWIDYTLLAEAVTRDSTFARLDLEPLVQQQLWQTMVLQLRDSVIQVDTFITETELRDLYDEEAPEVEVRARHIMLTYPVQASPAQRDSVREALQAARERIVAGASFESVAQEISQDAGSARAGGDLGYFGRGELVAPFERAALALTPGEMSEIVETPMGLHLIRVEDRRTRGFEEAAGAFRNRIQSQRVQEAESTFIAAVEARVGPTVADGAVAIVKEVARNPGSRLSGRAARRNVIEWQGGAITVGELQTTLRLESPALRDQLSTASDEDVATFLGDLARRDLLVAEARSAGLQPTGERLDTLVDDARAQLREAARTLGLMQLDQAPGEPRELAIARAVEDALADNLSGAARFVPLGLVAFQLRDRASFDIYEAGVGQAILRIGQVRASRALSPSENPREEPPDTSGSGPEPPRP
jgi:parvulin-like peptidyl-prolyl isomerase